MKNIPFCVPDISEIEINEVVDTLKSGWITTGPKTKELEHEIAKYCGVERAVCLGSNTACAEMTLRILGVGPGDEVIVPAYTYTASASVIEHVGAKIVMVDCEKDKFTMDYEKLEEAITSKTKVIIPVDIFGIPCNYDRIFDIANRKKDLFTPSDNPVQNAFGRIIVMADAAHALGATYKGRPIGSVADFTNFSFHAVKNFTTAEGGAVAWKNIDGIINDDIYRQYMLLSLHGQSKDAFAKSQLGSWEYCIVLPGYKCNMTDVHASIGLGQMKRYPDMLKRRKKMITKYNEAFKELPIKVISHYTDTYESSGHLYITRLFHENSEPYSLEERNTFITNLAKMGIVTNVHYKPLPMNKGYKDIGFDIINYPNSYAQFQNEVSLPLYTKLTDEDIDYIIACVKRMLIK